MAKKQEGFDELFWLKSDVYMGSAFGWITLCAGLYAVIILGGLASNWMFFGALVFSIIAYATSGYMMWMSIVITQPFKVLRISSEANVFWGAFGGWLSIAFSGVRLPKRQLQ